MVIYLDTEVVQPRRPTYISATQTDIATHIPWGYFCYTHYDHGPSKTQLYRAKDCIENFVNHLAEEAIRFYKIPVGKIRRLSLQQEYDYNTFTICHSCELEIEHPNDKVRDHSHHSGIYRGPAHRKCNLDRRKPRFIPILAHNVSGYDIHLIIKQLAASFPQGNLRTLTENTERYFTVSVGVVVGIQGQERKVERCEDRT